MEALTWRRSSYTGANGGDCVELARAPHHVATRDSKAPDNGTLHFNPRAFAAFLEHIKRGKYDL
jgi:hypothetical protein